MILFHSLLFNGPISCSTRVWVERYSLTLLCKRFDKVELPLLSLLFIFENRTFLLLKRQLWVERLILVNW